MTLDEYKSKLNSLEDEFRENKKILAKEYLSSNNPVRIGDIVASRTSRIKVEKIIWRFNYEGLPELEYHGSGLRKDLQPLKSGAWSVIKQTNMIKHIKNEDTARD